MMKEIVKELRKRAVEIGPDWSDSSLLNSAADEIECLRINVARYNFLRCRDLDTIAAGGVFAGMTPMNIVLNGDDLDGAVDEAMIQQNAPQETKPGANVPAADYDSDPIPF